MKKFLQNDFFVLIFRLLILYLILLITQVAFYFYNQSIVGNIQLSAFPMMLRGALKFDTVSILYLNTVFLFLSLLPFKFREKKWYQKMLFWIYAITNSIGIVIMNLSDAVYYRYTFKRITSEELHFFQENDNTGDIIWKSMGENWYLILIGILLIALMVYLYKKIPYHGSGIKKKGLYYPLHVILLAIGICFYVFGIRSSFDLKARPVALSNAAFYTQSAPQTAVILSNPFCTIRTIRVKEFQVLEYFDEQEAQAIFSPYHYPSGNFKYQIGRKNIVLFVLESFNREHSKYMMPHLNKGEGYTPFLDSLMREGFAFTNTYSNGRKSIESLPSILVSIPSYKIPFPLLPESVGEMHALPAILEEEYGYSTHFFCGTTENQMGFEAIGKMAGISHFYNRKHFEKLHPGENRSNVWGIWDMDFLQFFERELNQIDTPFFASVYTLTSHHPFVLPEEYQGKMPEGVNPLQPCVAYTDLSIRKFFEKASAEPWFDNTLFIFVADHASGYNAYEESQTTKGSTAIIYFLYTPDHSLQGSSHEVTQQLDIMPTVLGLMGYNKPYFAFGKDFFNEPERRAVATNSVNQVYQCISDSLSIYSDGEQTLYAFAAADTLQQHDILDLNKVEQRNLNDYFKAILQSYTTHIHNKSYVVPDKK
ncbi:MAG: LTA synthase family protein [Bacteroidales bacterium]|nr:LTA synthase family protein [Bacteroidales bacterium]